LLLDIEQHLVVRDEVQKQLLPLCLLALGAALVDSSEGHNVTEAVTDASLYKEFRAVITEEQPLYRGL
jgi:hypothetical protein